MIDALISGNLIRDPSTRTGQSGKPFCNFLLSVFVGEEQPVIVSGIAFAEAAEKIGRLKKGDSVAVVGALKPSSWQDKTSGETRHGLNVTAQACLSAYDVKKRRGGAKGAGQSDERPTGRTGGGYGPSDDGFDDGMDF